MLSACSNMRSAVSFTGLQERTYDLAKLGDQKQMPTIGIPWVELTDMGCSNLLLVDASRLNH